MFDAEVQKGNIDNEQLLWECAAASDAADLTADELSRIHQLYAENFGMEAAVAS